MVNLRTGLTRWLPETATILGVAVLASGEMVTTREQVSLLDQSGTVPSETLPLQRSVPGSYSDAMTWVRLALQLQESGQVRLRHTDIDNTPFGREVHWSSLFARLVLAAGQVQRAFTGEPLIRATERALAWFNLPLFLLVVALAVTWTGSRVGPAAAVLLGFGMVGHPQFYEAFASNNVDHHGLIVAACLGLVLGGMFMGAGWWRPSENNSLLPPSPRKARRAAVVSAVAGSIGMWISAASLFPAIVFVASAGILATWWTGSVAVQNGASFDPQTWRVWGRVGAAGSLIAYLLEYAPANFGLRLEVNHPLYAIAWLGLGEFVAGLGLRRIEGRRNATPRLILAAVASALPPIVLLAGGGAVFAPLDARMSIVHANILEFLSLFRVMSTPDSGGLSLYLIGLLLLLPAGFALVTRHRDRLLLRFMALVVIAWIGLAAWQVRWWLPASGSQLALLILVIVAVPYRPKLQWIVSGLLAGSFLSATVVRLQRARRNLADGAVTVADAMQPLYRDAAALLRTSQPAGNIVLLADPSASTGIGYFGRFKTVGTLYWENLEGLEAAAYMFAASSDEEALQLLSRRGVTHIAMVGNQDFLIPYHQLARPQEPPGSIAGTFGYRLLTDSFPPWLRQVPFRPPLVAQEHGFDVLLFQVVPGQSRPEASLYRGIAWLAKGDTVNAELRLREFAEMAGDQRPVAFQAAGEAAEQWGAHGLASRLFHEAVSNRTRIRTDQSGRPRRP